MTTASHSPASRSAKAPDTSPPNHLTDPSTGLQKYSCVLCKERKIKCDRIHPCNACSKAGVACIFRAPEPPRRRKRRDSDADERKGEAEKRKVKKYEEMLRKAGVDIAEEDGMRTADLPITSMSCKTSIVFVASCRRLTEHQQLSRLTWDRFQIVKLLRRYSTFGTCCGTHQRTELTTASKPLTVYARTTLCGSSKQRGRKAEDC